MAVVLGGLVFLLRTSSGDYVELLDRAASHAEQGERTAAIRLYEELTQNYPGQPRPYMEMGRIYLEWGRWEEALEAVFEAERRRADPAEVEELRVRSFAQAAERDGAERPAHWASVVEHGSRLLTLDPDNVPVRKLVARAHLEMRHWSRARTAYEELLQAVPSDPVVRQNLGTLLLGRDVAAVSHLRVSGKDLATELLAIAMGETQSQHLESMHTAAGRILTRQGEWALAARHLELAVEENAGDPLAHAYLGHALDHLGYRDEALTHLQRALELSPDLLAAHIFLGLHYDRWGDLAAARAAYEAAYDRDPQSAALCLEIGQTWAAERRYVAAEIWLREATTLNPNDPNVWEALARFYLDFHITTDGRAVDATERLLTFIPDDANAHDLRGWAAFQIGDDQVAERHLVRALQLDPLLASAYYHLGLLRIQQGRHSEAEQAFVRARDLDTQAKLGPLIERVR